MKFFTYVVNWNEVYNNVLEIEKSFKENNIPHKVINSGSMRIDDWMNVGDIRFYRQLREAVNDFDESYDYMFWLAGDVSYGSWKEFIDRANSVATAYNVWAYAPHLTHEPWHENSSKITPLSSDKEVLLSIQTDGIAVLLHKEVILMLRKYFDYLAEHEDITQLTSGWGMDMIWCAFSIYNNKLVLRDKKHILSHPAGSSYDHSKASAELKVILDTFYKFCDSEGLDSDKMKDLHFKIYGRMQQDPNYMTIESFYGTIPQISKISPWVNYHVIHINDERLSNRQAVAEVIKGERRNIFSWNMKEPGNVELFKSTYPDFKFVWDGFKPGEFGNFASHYAAWKFLAENTLDELLIFEDDVLIANDFMEKYTVALSAVPEDYDVLSIYVDPNQYDRYDESQYVNEYIAKGYQDWSTLCYVISKRGAEKLCHYVETIGFDHPTDWFIFRKGQQGIFNVYTLPPYFKNPLAIDTQYESQVQ